MFKCSVCRGMAKARFMCASCARSYDRHVAKDDGTLQSALKWAADRARQKKEK